ncbi:kinase-like domain-containing protein [Mycena amicta]|nr:kinase-like domain-containing protein [Mycena amicta]
MNLVIGVANGLQYLHSQGIIHGNLCTRKVLMNSNGTPLVSGYEVSMTLQHPFTTSPPAAPIRYAAPELLSPRSRTIPNQTQSADVYSFVMVMLEVMSGLQPYHHLPTEHSVFIHIVRGGRPTRTHLDPTAITNGIWDFMSTLWNLEPSSRPGLSDVIGELVKIRDADPGESRSTVGKSEQQTTSENLHHISSSGSEASDTLGDIALPEVHGRDLKGRVTQDDQYPFAGGGNSNIYRGKLVRSNGRKIRVAIKMLRMSDDGSGQVEDILRRLKREVDVWARLKHKNLLPFIGVCDDLARWPVLVSPFYKFGHVGTYIKKHPSVDRYFLARGIASGLQYLHAHEIIHGDLKVQNVLVDKRGSPSICDFGVSKILNHRGFTTSNVGTASYMAPELFFVLDGDTADASLTLPRTTMSSDVYSFGLLVLELLTSEHPKGRPTRPIVTRNILSEMQPKRSDYDEDVVPQKVWLLLGRCWDFEAGMRPPISVVLKELDGFNTASTGKGTRRLALAG